MSKEYRDLLKDPRWQKLKALAMIRDNFTCQECGATDKTLHVHHKKYTGRPWEAPLEDLVTLCDDCHNKEHTVKRNKEYGKRTRNPFFFSEEEIERKGLIGIRFQPGEIETILKKFPGAF